MSSAIRVAVIGGRGRMGRFACELLGKSSGFELVASFGRDDEWSRALALAKPAVAIDLTVAGRGFAHGVAILEAGVRPVIGTSGVTIDENAELDRVARARSLGGIVVPNFSLGSALMQRFAREAGVHFESAEIVELHHARKVDAPSGTALETARRIAEARGVEARARSAAADPARGEVVGGVHVHSVRMDGLYAHQEVLLGRAGELLSIRHDMFGPEAFGPGILRSIEFASRAIGVARGLEAVLG